jgi:hypothetical protein
MALRTIIAGSRNVSDFEYVAECLDYDVPWKIELVLSGTARGADQLGERWAEKRGIYVERYPADWTRFGKSAGYRRNEQMARNAAALIAFWDSRSPGTKHMIDIARRHSLRVLVFAAGRE